MTASEMKKENIEPLFYNITQAALRLGVSHTTLLRLIDEHPVFKPVKTEYSHGRRFHKKQIEIMAGVMLGGVDADTALAIWESNKIMLGLGNAEGVTLQGKKQRGRKGARNGG